MSTAIEIWLDEQPSDTSSRRVINRFHIKRADETIGRCLGSICAEALQIDDWIGEYRNPYVKPKIKKSPLPIGILDEITLIERFRGKGFSKPAVDRFLEWCEGKGCSYVVLNAVSQEGCSVNLVRLYEKSGFTLNCDSALGQFMIWKKANSAPK
jgi:GNAT superfamily N-acetyltransferase